MLLGRVQYSIHLPVTRIATGFQNGLVLSENKMLVFNCPPKVFAPLET